MLMFLRIITLLSSIFLNFLSIRHTHPHNTRELGEKEREKDGGRERKFRYLWRRLCPLFYCFICIICYFGKLKIPEVRNPHGRYYFSKAPCEDKVLSFVDSTLSSKLLLAIHCINRFSQKILGTHRHNLWMPPPSLYAFTCMCRHGLSLV